jgi:hypothetical protein
MPIQFGNRRTIDPKDARIRAKVLEVAEREGPWIQSLLAEVNATRLGGMARISPAPEIGTNSVRWNLEWQKDKLVFTINCVVRVMDDGHEARAMGIAVTRIISSAVDYEGHTPTVVTFEARLDAPSLRKALERAVPMMQQPMQ